MPVPSAAAGPSSTAAWPNTMVSALMPSSAAAGPDRTAAPSAMAAASVPRGVKFMTFSRSEARIRQIGRCEFDVKEVLNFCSLRIRNRDPIPDSERLLALELGRGAQSRRERACSTLRRVVHMRVHTYADLQ